MLDDSNLLKQRDPSNALGVAGMQYSQADYRVVIDSPGHDGRTLTSIVVAGMGGSALAALLAKSWLKDRLTVPLEIIRDYSLPNYVDDSTLVIASSYSGNTEEALSALAGALERQSQVGIIAAGGKLESIAGERQIAHVALPADLQPRMAVIYNLRALVGLLAHFGVVEESTLDEISEATQWLELETSNWLPAVSTDRNYAKQLALQAVGKTAIFYGGALTAPVAYKWKISWNENAKNTSFWNEYPEFNHNEFMGWASHPVEKPFAIFDLVSRFEHSQILKRFEISDRLLSGKRPKATVIDLEGETPIQQLLWGSILADFVSIYLAILNQVDPTPVALIEKLKKEL